MNTPVAAGAIVSVFPDEIVNGEDDSVQKHTTLPAPEPVELRISAYLMLLSAAPDAVNTNPIDEYVNLYCRADAPTVHCPVAGTMFRPFAA